MCGREGGGGAGVRGSRKARVSALRRGGVSRSKGGHGEYVVRHMREAEHDAKVAWQRQLVRGDLEP